VYRCSRILADQGRVAGFSDDASDVRGSVAHISTNIETRTRLKSARSICIHVDTLLSDGFKAMKSRHPTTDAPLESMPSPRLCSLDEHNVMTSPCL
jgi:hypothetical protein